MVELAVIIAVGSAYHQSVLTYNRPAAMLPVLGKPMIVRMMEQLYEGGIHHFVVIVGRDEGGVAAYLDKSWLPDVQVDFVIKPIEVDLVRVLLKVVRQYQQPFILASYNSFAHSHFTERIIRVFDESSSRDLMLTTAESSMSRHIQPYMGQQSDGYIKSINSDANDKTGLTPLLDFAICATSFESILNALVTKGSRPHHVMDIMVHCIRIEKQVRSVQAAWILPVRCDIDLLILNQYMMERDQHTHILSEIPTSVQIIPPVRIDPLVSVGPNAVIGPYVYLEAGSQVGAGARVQKALILQNGTVHAKEDVSNVLINNRTRIHA